jgi:transcriptional regulator with XRE-family HTH domain
MPAKKEIDATNYSGRIAARLRKLRTEKGWTVADLHERLNRVVPKEMKIAGSTLHGWDNGDRKVDPDYYPALGEVFGLTVRAFLPSE